MPGSTSSALLLDPCPQFVLLLAEFGVKFSPKSSFSKTGRISSSDSPSRVSGMARNAANRQAASANRQSPRA